MTYYLFSKYVLLQGHPPPPVGSPIPATLFPLLPQSCFTTPARPSPYLPLSCPAAEAGPLRNKEDPAPPGSQTTAPRALQPASAAPIAEDRAQGQGTGRESARHPHSQDYSPPWLPPSACWGLAGWRRQEGGINQARRRGRFAPFNGSRRSQQVGGWGSRIGALAGSLYSSLVRIRVQTGSSPVSFTEIAIPLAL